jgi:hypothetical protein
MDSAQLKAEDIAIGKFASKFASKTNWVPGVLHLPTLLVLLVCLVAVFVGIVVLYHFAQLSQLYEKTFIYQANVSIFNKQIYTVGPFSMLPTIIAVGVGLWWGVIDSNFYHLQPLPGYGQSLPAIIRKRAPFIPVLILDVGYYQGCRA